MRPDGCPKCRSDLHFSEGLGEQVCLSCMYSPGDEFVGNWGPEYIYSLSDWHTIVGMLTKQYRAKILTYAEYTGIVQQMDIDDRWFRLCRKAI